MPGWKGDTLLPSTPTAGSEQFGKYIRDEMAKYEKIIKDAKIKVD